ncbi:6340_t:CDS:2 [Diversispora eburnea]|uniref:6340_t:CDS:1 n=1 Tax=Diversispora eburnea TaxID=1213867 RepID=A0A9N8Z9K8_9GLOM|nr:6340_t:CDS:2 [Diversispora eburnea]
MKTSGTTTYKISTSSNGNPPEVKTFTVYTTTTTYTSNSNDPFSDLEKFKKEVETTFFDNDDFRKQFWNTNFDNHFNDNIDSTHHVTYEELPEQPEELPEEYTLYAKPTQEVKYEPCPYNNHKKALMIGINYKDPYRLNANIIREMKNFVKNVEKGDSGHGGQQMDPDNDEDDGYDETIMPLDFQTNGQIVDDVEMHHMMVDPLPAGVALTAIFDSCHSGTVLDLPYIYSTQGHVKKPKIVEGGKKKNTAAGERIRRKNLETKSSPAEIIMFSGCKDDQTSSDVTTNGVSTGAMSHAFIKALQEGGKNQTYKELLNRLRAILREKYSQRPQLSS